MEKCFVDSVCPPLRIQQAAVEIGHWFADNNIKHWEIANCASRDSFEQLRQRVAEKDEVIAEAGEMLAMRDRQLAALKTELREICAAIDDPACDLTLTAVECIKKLKAENESLRKDAERLDFILRKQLIVIQDCDDKYFTYNAQSGKRGPEMDSEAEAIDAAMAKGEKG